MNIEDIKREVRAFLVTKLSPIQLTGSTSIPMSDGIINYEIAQSFKPFSTCHRPTATNNTTAIPVTLKLFKTGTPDSGIKVGLRANTGSNVPHEMDIASFYVGVNEVYGSAVELTKNLVLDDYLTSKNQYWLVVSPLHSISSTNRISLIAQDESTYYFGNMFSRPPGSAWVDQNKELYFKFYTPGLVYTEYPKADLSIKSYPRLVVVVTGRESRQRWISHEIIEYILTLQVTGFSEGLDELDALISRSDTTLFQNRIYFNTFDELIPSSITRPSIVRESITSRAAVYRLRLKETTSS